MDTIGGGSFYQGERLGVYGKISNSQDGRNVYKQVNGDNYLFFLQSQKVKGGFPIETEAQIRLLFSYSSLAIHGPLQAYFTEIFCHDLAISEFT